MPPIVENAVPLFIISLFSLISMSKNVVYWPMTKKKKIFLAKLKVLLLMVLKILFSEIGDFFMKIPNKNLNFLLIFGTKFKNQLPFK